jgi:hypothetical protein
MGFVRNCDIFTFGNHWHLFSNYSQFVVFNFEIHIIHIRYTNVSTLSRYIPKKGICMSILPKKQNYLHAKIDIIIELIMSITKH